MCSAPLKAHYRYEQLAAFVAGKSDKKLSDEIATHLGGGCEVCQNIVEGIRYAREHFQGDQSRQDAWSDQVRARQHKIIEKTPLSIKKPKSPVRRLLTHRIAAVAASLVLIAGLGYYLYKTPVVQPPVEVARYLKTPYPGIGMERSNDPLSPLWEKAVTHYEAGHYEQAATPLSRIIEQQPDNAKARFYRGLCYLYQQKPAYKKSRQDFETVLHRTKTFYTQQARWFLALAAYLDGDKTTAEELLSQIAREPGHFQYHEARKLLDELK